MATTTPPEIHPLLRERRSSRSFEATHEIAEADLALLLEAARWAPSAGNSQPWAFLVVRRGEPAHQRLVALLSRGNTSWVPDASAVVITLFRAGDDEDPSFSYSDYAAYDLGQAVAHLTVQAAALGLGVHQFAGFDHDAVAREFAVPPAWQVTTGLAIGRYAAAGEERRRGRDPLSTLAFGDRFGEPRWP